jgi:hypothetical protein
LHTLREAVLPGEETEHLLYPGAVERFIASTVFVDTRWGQTKNINFYQLAEGRGWFHDYDTYRTDGHTLSHLLLSQHRSDYRSI